SGGLHGVGISVVNALSERVHVGICRDGYLWDISLKNGGMLDDALQQGEPTNKNGTTLTFYPDPEIFDTTVFDFETLRARFQQLSLLTQGLRITLTDERENATEPDTTAALAGGPENEALAGAEAELQSEGDDGEAAPAESTVRRVDYMYENGLLDYVTHLT